MGTAEDVRHHAQELVSEAAESDNRGTETPRTLRWSRRLVCVWCVGAASSVRVAALSAQSPSTDWPQWRGAERSGISTRNRAAAQWPRSGPVAGLVGVATGRRLRLGGRRGQSRLRAGHEEPPERRHEPRSRRRESRLVGRARIRAGQRSRARARAARRLSTATASTC